jgi:hypothetical protein
MLNQDQIFVPRDPVPRVSFFSLSVLAHFVVLAVLVLRHATAPQIVPTKYQMVQSVSGTDQVTYNPPPKAAPPHASPFHVPRSKQKPRVQEQDVSGTGTALETLRAHAKAATAGLMVGIKQRLIYGFSTNDYKLAIQTSGAIPVISANDLPPRFEQYLIVEVTIDTDGRVMARPYHARLIWSSTFPADVAFMEMRANPCLVALQNSVGWSRRT